MDGFVTWLVWCLIGIIGGYMGGKLLTPERSVWPALLSGLLGALVGGWLCIELFGDTELVGYVSLLVSAAFCGIFVWGAVIWVNRKK